MTLQEVFDRAKKDCFSMAGDEYSHRGRRLENWKDEILEDEHDYDYEIVGDMAFASQTDGNSNEYRFW